MANVYGIDVSEHNGTLNWAKIKAAGIRYAIIRTGYGKGYTDTQFHANMKGALAQGIPVGVYHFSYALDTAGARKEAAFVLSLMAPYKNKISLPVFYDFEYDTVAYAERQGVTLGRQAFNDHTVAFCETVKAAGYTPGVYYNLDYKNRFVDASRLAGYIKWYAQYNNIASWTGYDIWQYSSSYTIPGISARFDINVADDTILGAAVTAGAETDATKSVAELAQEVLDGKWGNGNEREAALTAAGYNYEAVQNKVNELLGENNGTESPEFHDTTKVSGVRYRVSAVSGLRLRSGAGTNKDIITMLAYGSAVWWYGYYSIAGGVYWYWVKTEDGKTGFVSSQYLKA